MQFREVVEAFEGKVNIRVTPPTALLGIEPGPGQGRVQVYVSSVSHSVLLFQQLAAKESEEAEETFLI